MEQYYKDTKVGQTEWGGWESSFEDIEDMKTYELGHK